MQGTMQFCFSSSKDEPLPLQQYKNLNCFEGHITAHLHHEAGEFYGNFWEKSASYSTYNTVHYEVCTFNVGDSLKFNPYNVQSYWQKVTNGLRVHCSPLNKFYKKTTTKLKKCNKQWEFCVPQQICFLHRFVHCGFTYSLKNYCGKPQILWYSPLIYLWFCRQIDTSHLLAHLTL
jgi:hypothetical protein